MIDRVTSYQIMCACTGGSFAVAELHDLVELAANADPQSLASFPLQTVADSQCSSSWSKCKVGDDHERSLTNVCMLSLAVLLSGWDLVRVRVIQSRCGQALR